ncbi:hypothetical protein JZ751_012628 [Albula glossodonta]|uniref:Uncharacterized protein n=1 Tax=Albula glossodonta TaxID=121402 RepID=A0A8T2NXB9_9TELE|nr:hypothetical protein JZ751_012628 [Albula glossodonta]
MPAATTIHTSPRGQDILHVQQEAGGRPAEGAPATLRDHAVEHSIPGGPGSPQKAAEARVWAFSVAASAASLAFSEASFTASLRGLGDDKQWQAEAAGRVRTVQVGQGQLQALHGLHLVALEAGQAEFLGKEDTESLRLSGIVYQAQGGSNITTDTHLDGPGESVDGGEDPSLTFEPGPRWTVLVLLEHASLLHRLQTDTGGKTEGTETANPCEKEGNGARQVGGEEPLSPTGEPVGLGQEAAGQEPVVLCHLTENHVLCENMCAMKHSEGGGRYGSTVSTRGGNVGAMEGNTEILTAQLCGNHLYALY